MSNININGQILDESSSSITIGSLPIKTIYSVFGEYIEIDGYRDSMTSIMVAQLNLLGKPFYDELKKQDIEFPPKINEFLKKKFEIEETAKQFIKR
jgi:hypothetical protein